MNIVFLVIGIAVGVAFGYLLGSGQGKSTDDDVKRKKILAMMTGGREITNDDVQKALGVSDATATRYLDELEHEGLISQIGDTGAGVVYRKK